MTLSPRLSGLLMALPPAVVLGVAAWLTPNPSGFETHRQLGLPPCGFFQITHIPCPACGMTTAFSWAAHARLDRSFMTQPAGCLLAMGCAMLLVLGLWSAATGFNGPRAVGRVVLTRAFAIGISAVLVLGWAATIVRHEWQKNNPSAGVPAACDCGHPHAAVPTGASAPEGR